MYKLHTFSSGQKNWEMIERLADSAWFGTDPSSSDYQAYLKWLEEGNTPVPADEQGTQP